MDHETVCNCPFMDTCETYADPLVAEARKGPEGRGCTGANDEHRRKHCKPFACRYLSMILSGMFHGSPAADAPKAES